MAQDATSPEPYKMTPNTAQILQRVAMLSLGVMYLVIGLTLSILGIVDLSSDPALEGVLPLRQLASGYVLLLTGGGCLLALLPLLCCRPDQKSYRVTMVILILGSLLLLTLNLWELATTGWHSLVGFVALLATICLVMQVWQLARDCREHHERDNKNKFNRWFSFVPSLLQLVFELIQLVPDDTDLLELAGLVVTHGTALARLAAGPPLLVLCGVAVCAALLKQDSIARWFSGLSGFLLLVLFVNVVVLLSLLLPGPASRSMEAALFRSMAGYGEDTLVIYIWDMLQSGFHCCGLHSSVDWARSGSLLNGTAVPWSCCRRFTNGTVMPCEEMPAGGDSFFTTGCLTAARQLMQSKGGSIAGATIGMAVLLIVSIVTGCCFKFKRNCQPLLSPA